MEILIQISEYLLTAIFFAPIVLLVVDLVKVPVNHLLEVFTCPKPEKLFWYVSIVLGALLGYLLLPELGHSNIEGLIIGIVSGTVPAPVLHDWLKVIRHIKDILKEWRDDLPEGPPFPL